MKLTLGPPLPDYYCTVPYILLEFLWEGVGWGGRLFEAERLIFSAFRMGAHSRWALIRGWALIRINTVDQEIEKRRR